MKVIFCTFHSLDARGKLKRLTFIRPSRFALGFIHPAIFSFSLIFRASSRRIKGKLSRELSSHPSQVSTAASTEESFLFQNEIIASGYHFTLLKTHINGINSPLNGNRATFPSSRNSSWLVTFDEAELFTMFVSAALSQITFSQWSVIIEAQSIEVAVVVMRRVRRRKITVGGALQHADPLCVCTGASWFRCCMSYTDGDFSNPTSQLLAFLHVAKYC